jgi:hypothetical protein
MKKIILSFNRWTLAAFTLWSAGALAQHAPTPVYQGKIGKTVAETQQSWPEKKKAPKGAPNVVWILLDDIGFGAVSTFGGLINTPTLDSLANNGLRSFTDFRPVAALISGIPNCGKAHIVSRTVRMASISMSYWPIVRSVIYPGKNPVALTSHFSCTSPLARDTHLTRLHSNGRTSTKGNLMVAGTSTAKRYWPIRSNWVWYQKIQN